MPEEERLKEDLERARESRKKDRSKHQFMQKYYHKGAFYQVSGYRLFIDRSLRRFTALTLLNCIG
jgi:microfibrillar-associated protein 1